MTKQEWRRILDYERTGFGWFGLSWDEKNAYERLCNQIWASPEYWTMDHHEQMLEMLRTLAGVK